MKLKRILALVLAGTLFMSVNGTAAASEPQPGTVVSQAQDEQETAGETKAEEGKDQETKQQAETAEEWQQAYRKELNDIKSDSSNSAGYSLIGAEKLTELYTKYEGRASEVTDEATKNKMIKDFWNEYGDIPSAITEVAQAMPPSSDWNSDMMAVYNNFSDSIVEEVLAATSKEQVQQILNGAKARCDEHMKNAQDEIDRLKELSDRAYQTKNNILDMVEKLSDAGYMNSQMDLNGLSNRVCKNIDSAKSLEEVNKLYTDFVNEMAKNATAEGIAAIREIDPDVEINIENEWQTSFKEEIQNKKDNITGYSFDKKAEVEAILSEYEGKMDSITDETSYHALKTEMQTKIDAVDTAREEVVKASGKTESSLTTLEKTLFNAKVDELTAELEKITTADAKAEFMAKVAKTVSDYIQKGQEEADRVKALNKRKNEVTKLIDQILDNVMGRPFPTAVLNAMEKLGDDLTADVPGYTTIEDLNAAYDTFRQQIIDTCGDETVLDGVDPLPMDFEKVYTERLNSVLQTDMTGYSIFGKEVMDELIKEYKDKASTITSASQMKNTLANFVTSRDNIPTAKIEVLGRVTLPGGMNDEQKAEFDKIISTIANELLEVTTKKEGNTILEGANARVAAYMDPIMNPTTPDPDKPGTDKPGTETPDPDKPGTDKPGTDKPGTETPDVNQPGTGTPSTDKPGTGSDSTAADTEKTDPSGSQTSSGSSVGDKISNPSSVLGKVTDATGKEVQTHMMIRSLSDSYKEKLLGKMDAGKAPGTVVWFYDVAVDDATFPLTLTLQVSGLRRGNTMIVHYINGSEPEYITPLSVTDNSVTFTVNSLSPIAVVTTARTTGNVSSPKTGDTTDILWPAMLLFLAVAGLGGCVVYGKKKKA